MELIWAHGLRTRIRAELLSRAPNEHGGAVLARFDPHDGDPRVLAIDYAVPADHEVDISEDDALQIDPAFWARLSKQAKRQSLSILPVHTHPFGDGVPRFSSTDVAGERRLLPVLERLTGAPTGAVVIGPEREAVATWVDDVRRVVGRCREIGVSPTRATENDRTTVNRMLSRNVLAFGSVGQARLSSLCVAVVGASGTGSHVCEQMIRLGVGRLIVVDDDHVEEENLNRIVTAFSADARRRRGKPAVVRAYAKRVQGPTVVEAVKGNVLDPKIARHLFNADTIFSCTDTVSSRAVMNRIAVQRFIPLWDCGTEISSAGDTRLRAFARVRVVFSGAACLVCMGAIDPHQLRIELLPPTERERERDLGYIRDANVPAPAVVSLNGIAASLAMMRFLEWAVAENPTSPGQWVYRSYAGDVRAVEAQRLSDCPVCSVEGRLGRAELPVQL
jgi:molybdopterin/thiamine biosynthesis adenylyltransferase